MDLTTLYSRTSTGAVQRWTIEVEGNKYRTHFGQIDGKQQTTEWTICSPKNEGRANATTADVQAMREAVALWKKKKESGCFENIEDIDTILFTEPMLAKKYEDYSDKLAFPVYSSSKIDGIRMVARKDGLWSRNGKRFVSVLHIELALAPIFEKYPDIVLDGELYCDKFSNDFNSICSLVKKTKPTPKDLHESAQSIQYWIYDTVSNEKFTNRLKVIRDIVQQANHNCIKLVDSIECKSFEDVDKLYEQYINDGYEGQMIRLDKPYENKRSKGLLKRKEFQDREYVILDVIEGDGNRTGTAGAMVFENDLGIRFNSNIKGSREYCADLLKRKNELIGKEATIKFFNLTPGDQIPRFPFVVAIREEYE
jgi:DNA ligase-1